VSQFLLDWHRETPYAEGTDWVFTSFKLKGAKPISGSQFVKAYIRRRFIEYGRIDEAYTGRAERPTQHLCARRIPDPRSEVRVPG
jgi:hypothetical protein